MPLAIEKKAMTPKEYLAWERARSKDFGRTDYFNGKLINMSGASKIDSFILMNIAGFLWQNLKSKTFKISTNDLRVQLTARKYVYPDIVVFPNPGKFLDDQFDTLQNPVLIIEILSDTTEAYDRGPKFNAYRKVESLREYLLVSQDKTCVECFHKNENGIWEIGEPLMRLEDVHLFKSLPLQLSVRDIYDGVELPPPEN